MPSRIERNRNAAILTLSLALAACGSMPERGARPTIGSATPSRPSVPRGPVSDMPVKVGKPYQVLGQWYYPSDDRTYDEVGYASWYGDAFHGGPTANGEVYDMNMVGAAHKTLPLPSYVEVTALETGRTIVVRLNDRGPFVTNRIIDLSRRAAEQLGVARQGVAKVRVRRIEPSDSEKLVLRSGRQLPERPRADGAVLASLNERFDRFLTKPAKSAFPIVTAAFDASLIGGYFIQFGAYGDRSRAESLASTLGGSIASQGAVYRVRTGPYFAEADAIAALARAQAQGYQDARLIRPEATN